MGVASWRGLQEVGVASGWNLWVWLECTGMVSGCCKGYSGIRLIGPPVKRASRFIGPFYLERNHVSTYVYKITPVSWAKYSVYWAKNSDPRLTRPRCRREQICPSPKDRTFRQRIARCLPQARCLALCSERHQSALAGMFTLVVLGSVPR